MGGEARNSGGTAPAPVINTVMSIGLSFHTSSAMRTSDINMKRHYRPLQGHSSKDGKEQISYIILKLEPSNKYLY